MTIKSYLVFICVVFILIGCKKDPIIKSTTWLESFRIPEGFPAIVYPEDNAFTQARWELGKKLFYDKVLSVDYSKSCASCHKAELAFSDQTALSTGVHNRLGTSNSPTLTNVAYHPYYTRAGGVPTLEMQILVPIQEHNEFDFNIVSAGDRIAKDSTYIKMSLAAYNRLPDYYVITRALANFERSLISGDSPYDQYAFQNNQNALSNIEKRGMALFFSDKTNCSKCHSGFNFTDYSFQNNGLYAKYQDLGRRRLTNDLKDDALFKVPTLRNISVTSPYMHDGSISSLQQVIEHYNSGGVAHINKSNLIKPLGLTNQEKEELRFFLESLTDQKFISDPRFKD